jgi:hypothetical protein
MRVNRRRVPVLMLAAAMGLLGLLIVQVAGGSHVRPKGASPLRASLVPAYKLCGPGGGTPNRTHGGPLVFPSCSPPVQASSYLTVGSPDANNAGANSIGAILLRVKASSPEDVLINATGSDVRCRPGVAATVCSSANTADGPDYSGELQGNATIRISDHYNGPGLNEAATVTDIPFPVNGTCASTPTNAAVGGTCTVATTANTVVPGSVKHTQRGVVEIQQLQINDGGVDGLVATTPNTLFEVQGIFIP